MARSVSVDSLRSTPVTTARVPPGVHGRPAQSPGGDARPWVFVRARRPTVGKTVGITAPFSAPDHAQGDGDGHDFFSLSHALSLSLSLSSTIFPQCLVVAPSVVWLMELAFIQFDWGNQFKIRKELSRRRNRGPSD